MQHDENQLLTGRGCGDGFVLSRDEAAKGGGGGGRCRLVVVVGVGWWWWWCRSVQGVVSSTAAGTRAAPAYRAEKPTRTVYLRNCL